MFLFLFTLMWIKICASAVIASESEPDILSLPYCSNKNGSGLVLVSTLDGKFSVLNSSGHLSWQIDTDPGPLLHSNIQQLELTNNGEWIRIIPSLSGTLYKFDGMTVDPIPISTETLLKSSFMYSDDLVVAGGIDVRTYGISFGTGKLIYECTSSGCLNEELREADDLLLIERTSHTIRAIEPRTGTERWNFSVGLHNVKIPQISCRDSTVQLFDWNVTAIMPDGVLRAFTNKNSEEKSWQYTFAAPIVRVWKWDGLKLTEIDLFAPKNVPGILSSPYLPSIYVGMHNKQLYIHESVIMQSMLYGKSSSDMAVVESHSIAKIPWKPIPASADATDEDDTTALSVLNGSEYVNGNGYYLFTEGKINSTDSQLCTKNDSTRLPAIEDKVIEEIEESIFDVSHYVIEFCVMVLTVFLLNWFIKRQQTQNQETIRIEKPVESAVTTNVLAITEKTSEPYKSRFLNDFETISCLGKGGFGVVFEVKAKIDECSYAIKRITLPYEQKSRDRVMREVKALAKLDHQNIVRYFCAWVEYPPFGWEAEHDKQWVEEKSYSLKTSTSASAAKSPARRIKSASISIDIPLQRFEPELDFDQQKSKNLEDDSFIVFENSNSGSGSSDSQSKTKYEITLNENSVNTTKTSNVDISNSDYFSEHSKKLINWKRPGRRHHSLDLKKEPTPPVYLYIQMQLCHKESLKEWLKSHYKRDYKTVLDLFLQILNAVEYVHLRGLIHRDLKPSNIFFSLEGQIKVGDFGLVKDIKDSLDMEIIKKNSLNSSDYTKEVGTQLYMSPEQLACRIYDYKVDIYSLGLIFFEMLVPFSTDMERVKMLTNIKDGKYPQDFREKFPEEYKLLQNMLCVDPSKRLTTIGIRSRPPFHIVDTSYSNKHFYSLNGIRSHK